MGEAARRWVRSLPAQERFEAGLELAEAAMRAATADLDLEDLTDEERARREFRAIRQQDR